MHANVFFFFDDLAPNSPVQMWIARRDAQNIPIPPFSSRLPAPCHGGTSPAALGTGATTSAHGSRSGGEAPASTGPGGGAPGMRMGDGGRRLGRGARAGHGKERQPALVGRRPAMGARGGWRWGARRPREGAATGPGARSREMGPPPDLQVPVMEVLEVEDDSYMWVPHVSGQWWARVKVKQGRQRNFAQRCLRGIRRGVRWRATSAKMVKLNAFSNRVTNLWGQF
jgi:hypothetical protein